MASSTKLGVASERKIQSRWCLIFENRAEPSVGRGAADCVVPEVNVDWRRPGQRERYPIEPASRMVALPNYDNLAFEVFEALARHYRAWITEHADHDIYAYIIYATPLVSTIGISVLTEQGLKQVAWDYKTKHGYEESLSQLEADLRWSVADTPYCGDYQESFAYVNERLNNMMQYVDSLDVNDPEFSMHTATLYSVLITALNQFRHEILCDEMRILLYVDFGDMSDVERLEFIEKCNDTQLVDSYRSSVENMG